MISATLGSTISVLRDPLVADDTAYADNRQAIDQNGTAQAAHKGLPEILLREVCFFRKLRNQIESYKFHNQKSDSRGVSTESVRGTAA